MVTSFIQRLQNAFQLPMSCKQGSSEQHCKVWRSLCLSHLSAMQWHAVETAGTWNQSAIQLIQEIGRRITAVTEDTRETVFLFQRLSIALQSECGRLPWLYSTPYDTPRSWSLSFA